MEQRENVQRSGECANCYEESDRLFDPPLFAVPRAEVRPYAPKVVVGVPLDFAVGASVWWTPVAHVPSDICDIVDVADDDVLILRSFEFSDAPVCWRCYGTNVPPSDEQWLCNKPPPIVLHGWHEPTWSERDHE